MTRVVVQVRCHDVDKGRWVAAAGAEGLSAWVRRVLDEECALQASLARERVVEPSELLTDGVVFARDLAGPAKPYPRR